MQQPSGGGGMMGGMMGMIGQGKWMCLYTCIAVGGTPYISNTYINTFQMAVSVGKQSRNGSVSSAFSVSIHVVQSIFIRQIICKLIF